MRTRRIGVTIWVLAALLAAAARGFTSDCTYTLSPTSRVHPYTSEATNFTVIAELGCDWTVSSTNDWLLIKLTTNGTGTDIVRYTVVLNEVPLPRSGFITVNGQPFEVFQEAAPCTYTLLPTNRLFGAEGGSSTLTILTPDTCDWSLNNTSYWITFPPGTNGSGNATLEYSVAPNATTRERQGYVGVGGETFVVSQLASPCSYTLSVSNRVHTRVAATSTVNVATSSNCAQSAWMVANSNSWVRILAGSNGMGNGTVRYGISANTNATTRTGTVFIADNTFRIEQTGVPCNFSFSSSSRSHTYLNATSAVTVSAALRDCVWNVVNTSSWIRVISPLDSTGPGVLTYQLDLNTGPERQGRLRIGTATFTITQGEADPVEIDTQPVGRGVLPGTTVTFSVAATGSPSLAYQWQFNSVDLQESADVRGTRTATLTLANVQPWQSGNYSVVVSNPRGPVSSAAALLRVNTPPVIDPISDKIVNRGTPVAASIVTRDQDVPVQTLTYTLQDAPAGATINSASGLFTWTPPSSQTPGTNSVVVRVADNGSPSLSSTGAFKVVVFPGVSTNVTFVNTNSAWRYRDTGEDLGSFWTAREYDDLPWRSGRGALGYGSSGLSTTVSYGPNSSAKYITTYFRHHFNVADPASVTALSLRVRRDDGVIVYLNGREAYRNNMSAGLVTFRTLASTSASSSSEYVTSPAAPDLLVAGDNVVAVEIHQQSAGSSDITFDLGLTATVALNKPSITAQPQPQMVFETENAAFTVAATGIAPLKYQWYFAGAPLAGATNSTLSLSSVTLTQAGAYNAVIANSLGSATSAVAILTVLAETNEPPLLASIGDYSVQEGTLLTFTARATDPNGTGELLTFSLGPGAPAGATIDASNGVFRWTPTMAQGPATYSVTIRVTDNGRPRGEDSETITITVTEVNSPPVLGAIGNRTINEGALLQFTATAADADLPAQALEFSLESGAPAGAAINPQSGIFSWRPTESDGPGSYSVTVRVTDGGAPRLSDTETILITVNESNSPPVLATIGNHSIPQGGSLRFTATASDSDNPAQQLRFSLDAGAPTGAAIDAATGVLTWTPTLSQTPSTNGITVRVSDNGSPVLTDSEAITVIVVAAPTTNVTLISTGAVWSFRDTGENLGTAWTSPLYDDLAWRTGNGPLGYGGSGLRTTVSFGPSSSAKHITTYFRRSFDIVNPAEFTGLNMRLRRDDGVVVYLNGTEVYRNNMPTGPITYLTEATTSASSTSSYLAVPLDPALLISEVNVIAASIHQESPSSSDIVFDLELTAHQTLSSLSIISHPVSQTASRGATVALSVSAIGIQPLLYQWYSSGTPITGGTNATLSLTNVQETQTGDYFAVVSNVSGSLTSAVARLFVSTATNTPPIISTIGPKTIAEGSLLTFTVAANDSGVPPQALSYSLENAPTGAAINAVNGVFSWTPSEAQGPGTNVVTVRVSDNGSPQLSDTQAVSIVVTEVNTAPTLSAISDKRVAPGTPVSFAAQATDGDLPAQTLTFSLGPGAAAGATIDSATGLFSFTPAQVGTNTITVRVRDNGAPPLSNAVSFTVIAAALGSQSNVVLIPTLSTWKYRDTGQDLGTAWAMNSFNDTAWSTGRGILGYGNSEVTTTVSFGPSSSSRFVTTYFRARFNIADPTAFTSLRLRVLRDDGVVVYLNGSEIYRDNMPVGPINYLTTAPINMDADDEITYFPSPVLSPTSLQAGENVVAVELHQKSVGSSDITFDLELTGMMSTDLPSILTHPVSTIVLQGQQATFSVTARNATRYQWHVNGVAIPNATNATLTIPNAQAAHAGSYHAMAINNVGTASSQPAELQVDQTNSVRFVVGSTNAAQGSQVDIPIRVKRFTNILSLQFSLHWDATAGQFVAVDQLGLAGLNFGTMQTSSGTITVSWDDGASVPRTLPDDAVLFVLRLELMGPSGSVSSIWLDGTPTAMEVANAQLQVLPSYATTGELRINPAAAPGGGIIIAPALSISLTADGQISLQWGTRPGAKYRLQACSDLAGDAWIDLGELTATGDSASAIDTLDNSGHRFYRVIVVE